MNLALQNYQWAQALISVLVTCGCQHFFIAPGSRSAPLSMAALRMAGNDRAIECYTHFDERSLAFAALGAAKATGQTAVVITSSGSAVANLLPAVVEAFQTDYSLVLMTADRPDELIGCGANQAIEQPGIFSHYVRFSDDLPLPESASSLDRLTQLQSELMFVLLDQPGPIHLNVPFREPLYSNDAPLPSLKVPACSLPAIDSADTEVMTAEPPILIIAGQLTCREANEVLCWAEKVDAPVLADIGSQLGQREHPLVFTFSHEVVFRAMADHLSCISTVVQFGGRLVSQSLMSWLASFSGQYYVIDQGDHPLDPTRLAEQRKVPVLAWSTWLRVFSDEASFQGVHRLRECQMQYHEKLLDTVQQHFSEYSVAHKLSELIPSSHLLMLGNSLSIRLFDQVAATRERPPEVFTNRGASGIDGLIACAAGISLARKQPMTVVVGDLSALYDLNSLYWLAHSRHTFVLVVLNNDGGQIFSMLPAADHEDVFDAAFRQPHGLSFRSFAEGFNLPYFEASSIVTLARYYDQACDIKGGSVIEVKLPDSAFTKATANIKSALSELKNVSV